MNNNDWGLRTNDFKLALGRGPSLPCTLFKRMGAAGPRLGFFWLLAIFCIFIPVLHFFLVPGLLLVGLIQFFQQVKNPNWIAKGSVLCPSCQSEISFKNYLWRNGLRIRCSSCSLQLTFTDHAAISDQSSVGGSD